MSLHPRSGWTARGVCAAGAMLLASCASSRGAQTDQVLVKTSTMRLETPTGAVEARTVATDRADTRVVAVPSEVAWKQMAAVYGELGLTVNTYVDQSRQIGAQGMRIRGHLGKLRMSQLVTCGTDVNGDDKANSYEVSLDALSTLSPAPGGETTLSTMVMANARPMATSGDAIRCVTTGQLERRIATALLLRSAGK